MLTVKEEMIDVIRKQPDDSSFDEILKELAFRRMIDNGIKDSENSKVISNEEMKRRILTWQK